LVALMASLMTTLMTSAAAQMTLRGGTPEGLPGYGLGPQGELRIDSPPKAALLQCVEQALNVRIVWQAYPTRRVLQMLAEQQLDLAFPMGFNEERAARLRQSEPGWDNPDVWVSLRPVQVQDKGLRLGARLGSPQHDDHLGQGYARVVGAVTYEELAKLLLRDMVDVVVLPRSVHADMQAIWPAGHLVSEGKPRRSGFYLPKADLRQLGGPLDQAIRRCRVVLNGPAASRSHSNAAVDPTPARANAP